MTAWLMVDTTRRLSPPSCCLHHACCRCLCLCAVARRAALRRASEISHGECSRLRQRFLNAATVDRSGGVATTGVRYWLSYVSLARGGLPFSRLNAMSPLEDKVEMEQMLMDFIIWLATCKPSGNNISARTIKKYVSQVRAWHLRTFRTHLCGDLDYSAVNDLMKGICREVAQPARRVRHGVRTQELRAAIDRYLSDDSRSSANWAAALTVAFCGLLRGAEFAIPDRSSFDPDLDPLMQPNLTRADISFHFDSKGGEYVKLMLRKAKGKPGEPKIPLLLGGGGKLLDPVKALKRLIELDPVEESQRARTPLFRDASRAALTVHGVRRMVKLLMARLGLDPALFGAHSLRIGGATAGLAAGLSAPALRAAGRWSSDIYLLYTRASRQAVQQISVVIGSTPFEDLERGQFVDEELTIATSEMRARGGEYDSLFDDEMIADALNDYDEEDDAGWEGPGGAAARRSRGRGYHAHRVDTLR